MNLIVLCGMSALFTALFGTPVAATVFSLEVVSVGILHYSALFPGLFASLVSLGVTRWMGLRGEGWTLLGMPELSPWPCSRWAGWPSPAPWWRFYSVW